MATETFRQKFRCGLSVILEHRVAFYKFKGKNAYPVELAGGQEHLFVRISRTK